MSSYEIIKQFEDLRLEAYKPTPNDVWTIGWGHTKTAKPGMTITRDEADALFYLDVKWAEEVVDKLVKVDLNDNQREALVSFVFNIGETNFRSSTLLRKLNAGDYEGAANEFPKWKFQKGKVLKGLVRRRAEEMALFMSAVDDPAPAQMVDEVEKLKPLFKSKEVIAGSTTVLTGLSTLFRNLNPTAQNISVALLAAGLVAAGLFLLWNRLEARRKGER